MPSTVSAALFRESQVRTQKSSTQPTIPEPVFTQVRAKSSVATRSDSEMSLKTATDFCPLIIASSIAVLRVMTSSSRHFTFVSNFLLPLVIITFTV